MATLHRAENGTPWLKITYKELSGYSGMDRPICDECLTSLVGVNDIVLIPILNEAFCPSCGKVRLSEIRRYPEDRPIEERRTEFYLKWFGLSEEVGTP